MKRNLFILVLSALVMTGCKDEAKTTLPESESNTAKETSTIALITPEALHTLILENQNQIQLLDVRTEAEVAEGKLPGAVNFSIADETFTESIQSLDKTKPVYIYCKSGRRSADASLILKENGFTEIYDLYGGINAWADMGFGTVH